jgi:hypothetical protein
MLFWETVRWLVINGSLDSGDLLVEIGDHRLDRILDRTIQAGPEPVLLSLSEVFKVLESSDQSLKPFKFRSKGQPRIGLLLETKPGDDEGVLLVGFVPAQSALGVVLDASGIDNADGVFLSYENFGECYTITAGGLQAGVKLLNTLLSQPFSQSLISFWRIREEFVETFVLLISEQHYVEAGFTDIDPKYHRASHPLCSTTPRVRLVNTGSGFSKAPPRIPSDLKKCGKGDLISFSGCEPAP